MQNQPLGPGRQQVLRLFLSADLAGSSKFKGSHSENDEWPAVFATFFTAFRDSLIHSDMQQRNANALASVPLRAWRLHGDEIVFVTELEDAQQLYSQTKSFYEAVARFDSDYQEKYGLGVKGTCWTAGFPIRNRELDFHSQFISVARQELNPQSMDEPGDSVPTVIRSVDYIGLEMDLGFRLVSLARPGRLVCSVDVAYLLANSIRSGQVGRFFMVGWTNLRGVFQDRPYPVLWLDFEKSKTQKRSRNIFEEAESEFSRVFLKSECEVNRQEMLNFCDDYYKEMGGLTIPPYIKGADMNVAHREIHSRTTRGTISIGESND